MSVIRFTPVRPFVVHVKPRPATGSPEFSRRPRRSRPGTAPSEVQPAERRLYRYLRSWPAQSTSSAHPTDSWPGPSGNPETGPSTCRRCTTPGGFGGSEKQQVAVLAERIGALLVEVNRRFDAAAAGDRRRRRSEPADHPWTPIRGRHDGAGLGPEAQTVVVELWPSPRTSSTHRWCSTTPRRAPDAVRVFLTPSPRSSPTARRGDLRRLPAVPACATNPGPGRRPSACGTNGYRRAALGSDEPDDQRRRRMSPAVPWICCSMVS